MEIPVKKYQKVFLKLETENLSKYLGESQRNYFDQELKTNNEKIIFVDPA